MPISAIVIKCAGMGESNDDLTFRTLENTCSNHNLGLIRGELPDTGTISWMRAADSVIVVTNDAPFPGTGPVEVRSIRAYRSV